MVKVDDFALLDRMFLNL